jgi:hypothetical protein
VPQSPLRLAPDDHADGRIRPSVYFASLLRPCFTAIAIYRPRTAFAQRRASDEVNVHSVISDHQAARFPRGSVGKVAPTAAS